MSLENTLLTRFVIPATRGKQLYLDAQATRDYIADRAIRPVKFAPPRRLDRRCQVEIRHDAGWPVYELTPRSGAPRRRLLYLHGGAYINEISFWHWWFLGRILPPAATRATVPVYPLGAVAGADRTVTWATDLAAELAASAGHEGIVLMGDSAGGGLALAVALALRDREVPVRRLVLISPWLDVATDDPESRKLEAVDPMLAIDGLVAAGRAYAGDLPLEDPRVSPLHGDLRGLPPITAFTSTLDLLRPDTLRLREACTTAGVSCEVVGPPGLPHVYPLLPTREGAEARRRICALLREH